MRPEMEKTLQWRPIQTAPTDGSEIILAVIDAAEVRHIDIGAWEPLNDRETGWATDRGDFDQPTHWLPLPGADEDGADEPVLETAATPGLSP